MIVAFANNQTMVAPASTTNEITTDPVPMGDNDRATAMLSVHYIFNTTGNGIKYQGQVSNDGVAWVDVRALTDNSTGTTGTTPKAKTGIGVNGAFLRFKFQFTGDAATGACAFDVHVLLDHA